MSAKVKIAIAILLVVSAGWAYQMFGTATVAVTSEPSGAVVRVDGRQRGITPLERLELDAGSHQLSIEHSHFAPHVEGVSVSRGDHLQRHIAFKPGEGTFALLSNPRGAWVEIDGERLNSVTPTEITLPSGEHTIAMGQAERHIVEEVHTVKHGQTLEVNFDLNIDPHGSLTIVSSPRNAKIEFLDQELTYSPKMRVQIGEYALRVSRAGYEPQEFRYQVRYGDNLHHVDLKRAYGRLKVSAKPADATIEVVYSDGGRTRRKPYQPNMSVPVGAVEVRAASIGYRSQRKNLNFTSSGATLNFNLAPMQVEVGRVFNDRLRSGVEGPSLVIVPAGSFRMGREEGPPSETPARTVTITQPFAVSRFEITVGDYLLYAKAKNKPLHEKLWVDKLDHAMAYVSFADAVGYADWLSEQTGEAYQLPSEAQWEYIARANSTTPYFFGDDPEALCEYGNLADRTARKSFREWQTLTCDDGMVRPGPVGQFKPNGFGVYDVYGNVSEWVLDCGIPKYAGAPTDGSATVEGLGCETHGVRGGSWDSTAEEALSGYRMSARSPNDDRGFRLVRAL